MQNKTKKSIIIILMLILCLFIIVSSLLYIYNPFSYQIEDTNRQRIKNEAMILILDIDKILFNTWENEGSFEYLGQYDVSIPLISISEKIGYDKNKFNYLKYHSIDCFYIIFSKNIEGFENYEIICDTKKNKNSNGPKTGKISKRFREIINVVEEYVIE